MGTPQPNIRHFCGESPSHVVELSPFSIMQVPVTNELFSIFNPLYRDIPIRDQQRPAVNLTWFDATVFAMWMGCRLPTEAEWEFACGGGSEGDWCCEDEKMLAKYAWYSDNSGGEIQIVGTREANLFGLYDFHGNIWEWCQDIYDQDFYSYSPIIDPVLSSPPPKFTTTYPFDRVCRGGCMHSFSEMCRTHYRFHEPPDFRANDLGIRLSKAMKSISKKGQERG
jgi:formylglycine-generating enzyme required for sulfatase activity